MAEEQPKRSIDECINAIAMNLELLSHQVQYLTTTMTKNFQMALDSINALGIIATRE